MQALVGAFKQFNTSELNGFKQRKATNSDLDDLEKYVARSFKNEGLF